MEVSNEEIKYFCNGDDKASGPDGYSAFFSKAWLVIGDDVYAALKEFFITGKLLIEMNSTLIALIPKTDQTTVVGEYPPIALCVVIYKCITKSLLIVLKVVCLIW